MNKETLAKKANAINEKIYLYLPQSGVYDERIVSAMNYSVKAGGKRLRPMLMQEAYRAFNRVESSILYRFMAAIECIHTYSLCHDDLPAMDNDEYRRGNLTTHAKYGEAFGILAGDGLLNYAYEIIAKGMLEMDPQDLPKAIRAFSVLSEKAGYKGMVGGQSLDVYFDQEKDAEAKADHLNYIYENKTAALLEASLMIGAILAGASDKEIHILEKAGSNLGFAFQIRDDVLDLTSTQEILGKPVGSDERNEKKTYVSFTGLEKAVEDTRMYSEKAISLLGELSGSAEELKNIFDYLTDREN